MSAAFLRSDERLARRAAGGDPRAFAAIFDRYQGRLYRFCLSLLGDRHDAQDALQNTMVKALGALPGEERRIELKPWLYRIAHNESVELLRRRRPLDELDPEQAGGGEGPAETAALRQRLAWLLTDLAHLPERQRGALVMRELGGLGFDQIGTALGTSPAAARQIVYEARLGLREMDAGRQMPCAEVTRAISDGDGRVMRRRDVRAHLRGCEGCRAFRHEIEGRERTFAALSPLPALAVAGAMNGALGGGGGGAIGAAVGGGAATTIATSTVLKGAATVAVLAAVGLTATDRGGLVPAGEGDRPAEIASLPGGSPPVAQTVASPRSESGGDDGRRTDSERRPRGAALRGEPAAGAVPPAADPAAGATAGSGPSEPDHGTTVAEPQHPGDPPQALQPAPVPGGEGAGGTVESGQSAPGEGAQGSAGTDAAAGEDEGEGEEQQGNSQHLEHPERPQHPEHPEHPQHPGDGS